MKPKLYLCYTAQHGGNVSVILDDDQVKEVQTNLHRGRPFGVWFRTDAQRLTGLTINPVMGGVTFSASPAQPIPVNQHGQPAQSEAEVAGYIAPEDQPQGFIAYPHWSNSAAAEPEPEPVQAPAAATLHVTEPEEVSEPPAGPGDHGESEAA